MGRALVQSVVGFHERNVRVIHVPPTLISFAVTTDELCKVVSPEFKGRGHEVVWLRPELGRTGYKG